MNRPVPSSSSSTLPVQSPIRRKSKSPNSNATATATATTATATTITTNTPHENGTSTAGVPTKHPSRMDASKTPPHSSSNTSSGTSWGVQWSTLQGLASSVLGSDVLGNDTEQVLKQRRQKPIDSAQHNRHSSATASETHTDSMRPRGRRRVDAPNNAGPRPRRNDYKRATSPDPESIEVADMQGERETLVYVHHVRPTDTVEGVVIAFNIPPGTLRKANGMWSHDSIQSRRTLLLPVDECQVKGKPVSVGEPKTDGGAKNEAETDNEEGKSYKHESYVIIEGIGQVEIARLARKKLSHFPPRRRKSANTRRLSIDDTPSSLLDDPPPLGLLQEPASPTNVFRGMTPGVGELHPQNNFTLQNVHPGAKIGPGVTIGPEPFSLKSLGELATDTAAGLENIGGVVEGFVRRWTAKAQGLVGGDLIELTQGLGFELDEEDRNRGNGSSLRGMSRIGSGSGRDGERRVVRERLTRREPAGEESMDRGRAKVL